MKRVLTTICALVLSISLVACSSSGATNETEEDVAEREAWMNSCVEMDYDTLAHNASSMKGQRIKITGEVFQVMNNPFNKVYMLNMYNVYIDSSGNFMQHVYVVASKKTNWIEGDRITIYGTAEGTQTYTTVLGAQRTIPKVEAKYITNSNLPNQITTFPDGSYIETNPNTGESIYHPAPQYQY